MTRLPQAPEPPSDAGYAYLEHTADIRIRCWGRTFSELVRQALLGTAALLAVPPAKGGAEKRTAQVTAPDRVAAVVQAVNELLFLFDVEGLVVADVCVEEQHPSGAGDAGGCNLRLLFQGDILRPEEGRYLPLYGVKAATYHGAEVRVTDDRWSLDLTLDV